MSDTNLAQDTTATEPPVNTEPETKARRLGWVPKEEFKGDPDRWRPADEFLERGERILPILQRDNEKLHRRLSEVETLLKDTRDASKELLEFTSKSEQRAYERARQEIEARIEAAAASADTAAVREGVRNLDALNKQHETAPPVKKDAAKKEVNIDPIIQDWIEKEEWFNRDRTLNAFATDTYGDLERSKPGVSRAELLAETKRKTVEKFPEKFGINPARDNAAAVASPNGSAVSRKRGKGYDDLPADAKSACDKFVRTIPGYTKEQYVAAYDWES